MDTIGAPVRQGNTVTANFVLRTKPTPSNPTFCFNRLLEVGIDKIQVSTSAQCNKNNVRVFINDQPCSSGRCTVDRNPNNGGTYIKIKFIPNLKPVAGTRIRIVGSGTCNTADNLLGMSNGRYMYSFFDDNDGGSAGPCCPSGAGQTGSTPAPAPPPPMLPPTGQPPQQFPRTCFPGNFGAGVDQIPYDIFANATGSTLCLNVGTHTCSRGAPANGRCCNMEMFKLEIVVNKACKNKVRKATLNGRKIAVSFAEGKPNVAPNGFKAPVLKLTNLNLSPSEADGAQICLTLDEAGCNSVDKVFYTSAAPAGFLFYAIGGPREMNAGPKECCGTSLAPVA